MKPEEIDWSGEWSRAMQDASAQNRKFEWDSFARRYVEWAQNDDYPQKLLDGMILDPQWTVLDIGAGTGALTIPMAKKVRHVTALDFSDVMLRYLEKSLEREQISNVTCLNKSLEAVDPGVDLQPHDVVLASRSMVMTDVRAALEKIRKLAKKSVVITWRANERKFDRLVYKAIGREYHEYPGYLYLVNILYQMGVYADIRFIDSKSRVCYLSLEDAMDHWRWKIGDLTPQEEEKLRVFLSDHLSRMQTGNLEALDTRSIWAVLSWNAESFPGMKKED